MEVNLVLSASHANQVDENMQEEQGEEEEGGGQRRSKEERGRKRRKEQGEGERRYGLG